MVLTCLAVVIVTLGSVVLLEEIMHIIDYCFSLINSKV